MSQAKIQTDTCWRAAPPDSILWAHWGDNYVAYHKPSGLTHFLNAASKDLLTGILIEANDTAAIAGKFASPGIEATDPMHLGEIVAMLERLEHLGLVERV